MFRSCRSDKLPVSVVESSPEQPLIHQEQPGAQRPPRLLFDHQFRLRRERPQPRISSCRGGNSSGRTETSAFSDNSVAGANEPV